MVPKGNNPFILGFIGEHVSFRECMFISFICVVKHICIASKGYWKLYEREFNRWVYGFLILLQQLSP